MASRALSLLVLAFIACAAALPGVFSTPVFDRDEALFAQASAQMAAGPTDDDAVPACLTAEQAARSPIPARFTATCFGDAPRLKKPIGIYWAQALSVSQFAANPDTPAIWMFRIPSVIGIVLAVWGTYAAGCSLIGRRGAFLGAVLFGVGVLAGVEGGMARTDALLTGLTTLAMAALARLYITQAFYTQADEMRRDPMVKVVALGFWVALALGVLVKGPVAPFIAVCTVVALFMLDRRVAWLKPLAWWPGVLAFVVIAAPWYVVITLVTEGAYLREALGQDLGAKLVSGQETHAAPPFTHALLAPVLLFPATFVLLPGLARTLRSVTHTAVLRLWMVSIVALMCLVVWRSGAVSAAVLAGLGVALVLLGYGLIRWFEATAGKRAPDQEAGGLQFLLAWTWLAWVVFELAPTKLPHYPLTVYPALALMAGNVLAAIQEKRATGLTWGLVGVSWLLYLAVGVLAVAAWLVLDDISARAIAMLVENGVRGGISTLGEHVVDIVMAAGLPVLAMGVVGGIFAAFAPLALVCARSARGVVVFLAVVAVGWHVVTMQFIVPRQTQAFTSMMISNALRAESLHPTLSPLARSPVAVLGYGEPSLVFLTGGQVALHTVNAADPDDIVAKAQIVAEITAEEANRAAVVDVRYQEAFLRAIARLGASAVPVGPEITTFNYSRGEDITLAIYRVTRASPARVRR